MCAATGWAQTAAPDTHQSQELSAGFRYEVKLGENSYDLNNRPGYAVRYSYHPRHWLAIEAGLEQIPRPIGRSVCCEYIDNANDELFLVPFGVRYTRELRNGRTRLSLGGGGAYLNHVIGQQGPWGQMGASGWGGQFVAAGDYRLTRSGRFRAGLTVRYYYLKLGLFTTARILTVGPDFTFSFR